MCHFHFLQFGCALGSPQPQAEIPCPSADNQPDCGRSSGYLHRDARWRGLEHHSPVAGRRPGVQITDVPQAAGHVLLRLCHGGDKSWQTVGYTQPSGHQHGPEKEQGHADRGLGYERLVLDPPGKAW